MLLRSSYILRRPQTFLQKSPILDSCLNLNFSESKSSQRASLYYYNSALVSWFKLKFQILKVRKSQKEILVSSTHNVYMRNRTIVYYHKMEYGRNFWLKVSFTISTIYIHHKDSFLKSLHARRWSFCYWICHLVQKFSFLWSKSKMN